MSGSSENFFKSILICLMSWSEKRICTKEWPDSPSTCPIREYVPLGQHRIAQPLMGSWTLLFPQWILRLLPGVKIRFYSPYINFVWSLGQRKPGHRRLQTISHFFNRKDSLMGTNFSHSLGDARATPGYKSKSGAFSSVFVGQNYSSS